MAEASDNNVAVAAPDRAEFEQKLAEMQEGLKQVEEKLSEIQASISAQDSKSEGIGNAKTQVLENLRTCRTRKAELLSTTSSVRLQMQTLDRERMVIRRQIQGSRLEVKAVDMKQLDASIKALQKTRGQPGVAQQISALEAQRPILQQLNAAIKAEEKNEKESEKLRKDLDKLNKDSQKVRREENKHLDKISDLEKKEVSKEMKTLLKAKKENQQAKSKLNAAIKAHQKDFDRAVKAHHKAVRQQQRREAKAKAAVEAKANPDAQPEKKEEKKVVKRDIYVAHKKAVASLISYLTRLLPQEKQQAETKVSVPRNNHNAEFKGRAVRKFKKQDEGFFGSVKQKKKRGKKVKRSKIMLTHPPLETSLFAKVQVAAPTSVEVATVQETITALRARLDFYNNPDEVPAPAASEEKKEEKKTKKSVDDVTALFKEAEELEAKNPHTSELHTRGYWTHGEPEWKAEETKEETKAEEQPTEEPDVEDAPKPAEDVEDSEDAPKPAEE